MVLIKCFRINQWSLKNWLLEFFNLKHNFFDTVESVPYIEATEIPPPNSSTLKPISNLLLQVPTKTSRSSSDIQFDPNMSEISESIAKFFDVSNRQFQS